MASEPNPYVPSADEIADDLIERLKDIQGVQEIYSEYGWPGVIITAFVDSQEAEFAAIELELEMARRCRPDVSVDLRVFMPSPEEREEYRRTVPETLEWVRV
jgi:hypothetical protein